MKRRFILVFFTVFLPFILNAQTLSGTTGLLNIPSAEMQDDGTFIMGANYLPKINQPSLGYNSGNYYLNLTFLPFFEVALRCTLLKRANGRYTGQDRSVNVRFQLIKEKEYIPAITIGVNDLYSESKKGNQHVGSSYIVLTKHFKIDQTIIGVTSGYGFKILKTNQIVGLFGGLALTHNAFKQFTFMSEYDGKGVNLGGSLLLFKHLYLLSMVQQLKYFTGGVAYRIKL